MTLNRVISELKEEVKAFGFTQGLTSLSAKRRLGRCVLPTMSFKWDDTYKALSSGFAMESSSIDIDIVIAILHVLPIRKVLLKPSSTFVLFENSYPVPMGAFSCPDWLFLVSSTCPHSCIFLSPPCKRWHTESSCLISADQSRPFLSHSTGSAWIGRKRTNTRNKLGFLPAASSTWI